MQLQVNPDSDTSSPGTVDSPLRLLQALNDERQAAIDECVAAEGAKNWINNDVDPKQLNNPVKEFKNAHSITCLTFASLVNGDGIVRQLVESGADVGATDWSGCTPLHYACASSVEAQAKVEYMLQRDASLANATNYSDNVVLDSCCYSTPLHVAARHNQPDCVKTLVSDGKASVNATDGYGLTALLVAASAGSTEAVNVLVQHQDCRVNATDQWGSMALHYAARVGNTETVKVIVQHPTCQINATDPLYGGGTALHHATRTGNTEAIIALAERPNCRGNATDWKGRTALHLAVREMDTDAITVLASHLHCDFSIKDRDGKTAANEAGWGQNYIAAVMEEASRSNFPLH